MLYPQPVPSPAIQIQEHIPLAPYTTLGIGGPARFFCEAHTEAEVAEAAKFARDNNLPLFALGGGSNILVNDTGFDGLVTRVAIRSIQSNHREENVLLEVGAGEDWNSVVLYAIDHDYAGVECLAGIPGDAGGTPVQNVGAYGQEVSSVISQVRALDLKERLMVEFEAADCRFSYRRSRFNTTDAGRFVVTRVDYQLTRGGTPTLKYPDLQRAFPPGSNPTLSEVSAAVRSIRQTKAMVLVDCEPDCRSAGSFFKNPIIPEDLANRIEFVTRNAPPRFPAGEGKVKIPAAWLIEQAGFLRGFAIGNAGISTKHTLALVNRGGATASEILALAAEIRSTVEKKFGVVLHPEPVFVGF
jgi:UDP-N-acetylmuramate dehydrogenase